MPPQDFGQVDSVASAEKDIQALYGQLLDSWNLRDAVAFAGCFSADGETVGFDGSAYKGRSQIESALARIFAQHQTPAYVAIVRDVHFLTVEVAILSAVAGMAPAGQSDLNPAVNAVQRLVALKEGGR